MDLQEEAITLLAEILKTHGYAAQRFQHWLMLDPSHPPALAATVSLDTQSSNADRTLLRLDIQAAFSPKESIVESFAGIGKDLPGALRDAFANFVANSLHVFLAAFWNPKDDHVITEYWEINGKRWRAVIGNFGTRTWGDNRPIVIPDTAYSDLAERVQTRLRTADQESQRHWFRFYYGSLGQAPIGEVLFDNEEWPEAQTALKLLPWDTTRRYSIRCFTILQQENP